MLWPLRRQVSILPWIKQAERLFSQTMIAGVSSARTKSSGKSSTVAQDFSTFSVITSAGSGRVPESSPGASVGSRSNISCIPVPTEVALKRQISGIPILRKKQAFTRARKLLSSPRILVRCSEEYRKPDNRPGLECVFSIGLLPGFGPEFIHFVVVGFLVSVSRERKALISKKLV
jgi:hypothetical protein